MTSSFFSLAPAINYAIFTSPKMQLHRICTLQSSQSWTETLRSKMHLKAFNATPLLWLPLLFVSITLSDHQPQSQYGSAAKDVMKAQVSGKLSDEMRSLVGKMRNQVVINARALQNQIMRENLINFVGQATTIGSTTLDVLCDHSYIHSGPRLIRP